ncbi:uridine diphosphate-N-acetylglucosamine-binding protein YvcK [Actinobacillus minor]|uniref:gluconeogenesis factor YvcK family protein n=1 Tax=Actinobacillus minor TaxID=51047 RepID=UPI0026ECFD20|nr:uridine diphosphate-N-acetylglucosamine-binding protein YvcK [Actinobacillus minor]
MTSTPRHPHLTDLNIVALGGGHGLGRVLSALSFLRENLTGIVATTDNGGSTGRIRSQQGGIAWGDLRNCLTQIIVKPTVASALFEYRFPGNGELGGHNLGNLILKALENMQIRPLEGLNLVRDLLHVRAFLIPMSETPVDLGAYLANRHILGEVAVDALEELPQGLFLEPEVQATPEALLAIEKADVILLGPGSFFTSIMPNLLIPALAKCINQSSAKVIFIDNIGIEHSIVSHLTLADRVQWIEKAIGSQRVNGVITPPTEMAPLPEHLCVLRRDLSAEDVYYRHDRYKLSKAINDLVALIS